MAKKKKKKKALKKTEEQVKQVMNKKVRRVRKKKTRPSPDVLSGKRNSKGQLNPGFTANPNGRPRESFAELFRSALTAKQIEKKKSLIELFVEKAYDTKDPKVMLAAIDRMLPTLKSVSVTGGMSVGMLSNEEAQAIQDELRKKYE